MTDDKQDEVMEWLSQEHCWARSDARERINDTVNIIRAQKDRIAELEAVVKNAGILTGDNATEFLNRMNQGHDVEEFYKEEES